MTKILISQNAILGGWFCWFILLLIRLLYRGGKYVISQNFWEGKKGRFFMDFLVIL